MIASDYLTEEAQIYTVTGDRQYLDNYFIEAEQTRRRETAVAQLESYLPDSEALVELKAAMTNSLSLMDREYYAMLLMLTAQEDPDIPQAMRDLVLAAEDQMLSAAEKKTLAMQMMHDEEYFRQKGAIRAHMEQCIEDLKTGTRLNQNVMEDRTSQNLIWMVVLIVILSLGLMTVLWLTTRLGVNPPAACGGAYQR